MTGNLIYRGPIAKEPQTVNLPVAGAYLPGILVVASATALTQAVAADALKPLHVLSNMRFTDQDIATAYASGDTGIAYEALSGEVYQVRMAAGTYALNAPLTVDANGRLAAAGVDAVVVAFCAQAGTFAAGDLADARIADKFRTNPA